jgi:hypothetical protein
VNSVGNAGADPYCRTLTYLHKPSHKNAGSDACKIVKCAVVVHRAGRIDDGELTDPRTRPYVRAGENSRALAHGGRRRDHRRWMLDDRKLQVRTFLRQIAIDLAAPPVVPNRHDYMLNGLIRANAGSIVETGKYGMASLNDSWRERVIQVTDDVVQPGKLNGVN